jgi:large subunit ribosomal protein L10
MARPEKEGAVKAIVARFENAEATLLTEYRGLKVSEIAEVRRALRQANAEYRVLKNTLARIAVREVGLDDLVEWLEGPTAIVFVKGDVAEAAKALDDAVKKYPVLVIKGGTLRGGKLIDADQAKALAALESREVLLTKIAMMLNQPAQLTVNVLAALLRDLGSMLGQVLAAKESAAPDEEPEAPTAQTTEADEAGEASTAPETDQTEGETEEGKPEGDTATPEPEGDATPEAAAEDIGVPSPEEGSGEGKAAGSDEDMPVPQATGEETTGEGTESDENEEEEK